MNVRKMIYTRTLVLALTVLAATGLTAAAVSDIHLTVDTQASGLLVSPMLHGIFFEDINYGADGGLYAELVQNRSFEHRDSLFAWSTVNRGGDGSVEVVSAEPLNPKNPHFLRLQARSIGEVFGVANSGFGGIALRQGERYLFSLRARGVDAVFKGQLRVQLSDPQGHSLGETTVQGLSGKWERFEGVLTSNATTANAQLMISLSTPGQVDLDVVSLFPENTWKNRPNGVRADLAKLLADMRPGFMRFPGGCIVEGKDLSNAYRWKDTIGDIAERPENWNRWQSALRPGQAPQYYQTYGLGFFEYFQLCEDIGAEPVPILNCGMSCQYQDKQLVPIPELDPYVQDAVDLLEFANGDASTHWGAKRAAMGHPAPFHLKYLGVGNEQWGEQYFERYKIFYDALKSKDPGIHLVTTSGPGVDDQWWRLAWGKFKAGTPADIVDEHYYRPPNWFLEHSERYDNYDRKGPKVFAGEFAAHDRGRRNSLRAAIAEAAFMTGLVRNADVIAMSSYAPLFAKVGSTQWTPDLIWFDNTRAYGSPSYYVQALFSQNRPDAVLPLDLVQPQILPDHFSGKIGVGTSNALAEFKDIEVTKEGRALFRGDFSKGLEGWETLRGHWEAADGVLRQTVEESDVTALAGDPSWTDYILSLKARKLQGKDGLIVSFQAPGDGTRSAWILGGGGNKEFSVDVPGVPESKVQGHLEDGKWYDLRIELKGLSIKCFLDGKLLHDVARQPKRALYAAAGRMNDSGEVILNVVNVSGQPAAAEITLRGMSSAVSEGSVEVLTGASQDDENSFDNPLKVAPHRDAMKVSGASFPRTFAANSVTILRLKPSAPAGK